MHSATVEIIHLPKIKNIIKNIDLIPIIEEGFAAYSQGRSVVPPVGELLFEDPPGDTHIKYGYIKGQEFFTVKIASGFYNNPELGIKASQGVILLFSQKTGELKAILLDEGYLTDIRTVIASMITLKYLAPMDVEQIGIIGTGIIAKLHLEYLDKITDCKKIMVWGRDINNAESFKTHFSGSPYNITIAESTSQLAANCNVIITATPSNIPLLELSQIRKGTHITAIGSDTSNKCELDPDVIGNADIVVSDSIPQSQSRGEVFRARKNGSLNEAKLVELGEVIKASGKTRTRDDQLTVADLTGVAVQDIMIATAVYDNLKN